MEARKEWDSVFSDLQSGMIEIKSKELAQLVTLADGCAGQRLYPHWCFRIIHLSVPNSFANPL